jgi:copper homeostasis protein (lipoprotein)
MKDRVLAFFSKHVISIAFVSLVLLGILGVSLYNFTSGQVLSSTSECALDTKQCEDGSQVGRSGPQCEFQLCPGALSQSELSSLQLGTFTGTLPCDDCEGTLSTLILTRQTPTTEAGTFTLQEDFQGKGNSFRMTAGNWQLVRGSQHHPNAEIYKLTVDSEDVFRYFLKTDENTLLQLNPDQTKINSTDNYTLKK